MSQQNLSETPHPPLQEFFEGGIILEIHKQLEPGFDKVAAGSSVALL